MNTVRIAALSLLAAASVSLLFAAPAASQKGRRMPEKIVKSDAEWQKELTPEQYQILRKAGTERAFTGATWNNHETGTSFAPRDGNPLFSSDTKFDSGTGWPSFWAPISEDAVAKSGRTAASSWCGTKSSARAAAAISATCSTTARRRRICATA